MTNASQRYAYTTSGLGCRKFQALVFYVGQTVRRSLLFFLCRCWAFEWQYSHVLPLAFFYFRQTNLVSLVFLPSTLSIKIKLWLCCLTLIAFITIWVKVLEDPASRTGGGFACQLDILQIYSWLLTSLVRRQEDTLGTYCSFTRRIHIIWINLILRGRGGTTSQTVSIDLCVTKFKCVTFYGILISNHSKLQEKLNGNRKIVKINFIFVKQYL